MKLSYADAATLPLMLETLLTIISLQNPFPLEREKKHFYKWDKEIFALEFVPERVTYHVEFTGAQANATSKSGSRYVTTILYFPERKMLLAHLFLRVALNPLEPSLNCAMTLKDGVWQGLGRMESAATFVTKLQEGKLYGQPCSLEAQ
ncbi:MAG: hypothetical protein ACK41E_07950 [Deinococcales bacterium]